MKKLKELSNEKVLYTVPVCEAFDMKVEGALCASTTGNIDNVSEDDQGSY